MAPPIIRIIGIYPLARWHRPDFGSPVAMTQEVTEQKPNLLPIRPSCALFPCGARLPRYREYAKIVDFTPLQPTDGFAKRSPP